MKKFLAMFLALLMLFGVTAYGITLEEPIEKTEKLLELPMLALDNGVSTFTTGAGGTFYIMLDPAVKYEKVTVTESGCVDAKVFEYDPEKHAELDGIFYCVKNGENVVAGGLTYKQAKEKAEELNKAEKTTLNKIALDNCYVNVIEITVEDNYTAAYKKGEIKIAAKVDKKDVAAKVEVISDVFVYDVENVKYAGLNDVVLDEMFKGVSSYDEKTEGTPTVIPVSAFRYLKGEDLTVYNGGMEVTFKNINASQPALNLKGFVKIQPKTEEKERELAFGFYGKEQKVYSDFVIKTKLDLTYFGLRELFDIKVEEQDIVIYKLYKNDVLIKEIAVDYMTIDPNKNVEFEIIGKAGQALGKYHITAELFEETVTEEENPNTGAPIFI